jgi:hypothetical protein
MEKAMLYANHVGLYFAGLDRRGFQLGNFPQALTHLAVISAAYFLDRSLSSSGPGTCGIGCMSIVVTWRHWRRRRRRTDFACILRRPDPKVWFSVA